MTGTKQLAEKLATHPDDPLDFTEDEREALKTMAQAYLALEVFGRLASAFKSIAVYVGWIIAGYLLLKGNAVDWIRSVVR